MKLSQLISEYVAFKKSLGEVGRTDGYVLRAFGRAMGDETDIRDVQPGRVNAFLAGTGPVTSHWHRKHCSLVSFYRYVIGHGHVASSPLPTMLPKQAERFARTFTPAMNCAVCSMRLALTEPNEPSWSHILSEPFYCCFTERDCESARLSP